MWISLLMSNGRKAAIGSGPRYLVIDEDPEHHLQPVEQEGHHEVGIGDGLRAIAHVRSLLLQGHEIGHQRVDLRRLERLSEARRHQDWPLLEIGGPGDQVRVGIENRLPDVARGVGGLAVIVRRLDPRGGGGGDRRPATGPPGSRPGAVEWQAKQPGGDWRKTRLADGHRIIGRGLRRRRRRRCVPGNRRARDENRARAASRGCRSSPPR